MLDSYEENELIWDGSDTQLIGYSDHGLAEGVSKRTSNATLNVDTTTSNSSLEKSLSICFSDISSVANPQEHNSDCNSDSNPRLSSSDLTDSPVIGSSLFYDDVNGGRQEDSGPVLSLEFNYDIGVERSINGIPRLTQLTDNSSSSLYSYSGDDRRSKSYGDLKSLDHESRVVTSGNRWLTNWRDDTINCSTPMKTGYRVTFEIISARTVTTKSSSGVKNRYVSYTIIIKRYPGLESQPGVIERRYSEFFSLYMSLTKRFPILLKDFNVPKKTLVGNFSSQVIRDRTIAFQSLLTYCLSVDELRTSRPFTDFLHTKEIMEVRRALKLRNFEEAANILENCYFIQEKISLQGANDQSNAQVYQILILLVASMKASGSPQEALTYAEKAIPMILESDFYDLHELTVPFIHLIRQLFECSGKPVDAFDNKLSQLQEKGVKIYDKSANLVEIIVKKDCTSLTCSRFF